MVDDAALDWQISNYAPAYLCPCATASSVLSHTTGGPIIDIFGFTAGPAGQHRGHRVFAEGQPGAAAAFGRQSHYREPGGPGGGRLVPAGAHLCVRAGLAPEPAEWLTAALSL